MNSVSIVWYLQGLGKIQEIIRLFLTPNMHYIWGIVQKV